MRLLLTLAAAHLATGQRDPCELTTCSGKNKVCDNGACVTSTAVGMLDAIAKFATDNNGATYATTTTSTFDSFFTCAAQNPADYKDLMAQQHHMWQGAVDYAREGVNRIFLEESEQNPVLVEVVDAWGARCKHDSQPNEPPSCSLPSQSWWFECPEGCLPKGLMYRDPQFGNEVLDIDIYEPCNFVSNLAYYRVMYQVCGPYFNYDASYGSAFQHAFGALAPGSALWHGSHTYMGKVADVEMVGVVAFLIYQLQIGGIGEAVLSRGNINNANAVSQADFQTLMNLGDEPRPQTSIELALAVNEFITSQHVSEWAYEFDTMAIPSYTACFTMIITAAVAIVFEHKPQFVTDTLNELGTVLPGDTEQLNRFLPTLLTMGQNLNLSDNQKFVVFRQLMGMGAKMLYAFLWQEKTIDYDFGNPQLNAQAPYAMPTASAFFNFLSGFTQVDQSFQRFEGMYPGDRNCRATQPHAKWHEVSASGLLDMIYMADCIGAVGKGLDKCAHMSTLAGKERITKAELKEFFKSEILLLNIPAFPADAIVLDTASNLLANQIFPLLDVVDQGNDEFNWADIDAIPNLVVWVKNFLTTTLTLYENFCTADVNCGAGRFCDLVGVFGTPLQCVAGISNGRPCAIGATCQSGTCGFGAGGGVCGTGCGGHNMCNGNEWCSSLFAPKICQAKQPGGFFPCVENAQCVSGECAWYGECRHTGGTCDRDEFQELGVCIPKLPQGSICTGNHMCLSNSCTGNFIRRCTGSNAFRFCSDLGCSQKTLNESIQAGCAKEGCSEEELNKRISKRLSSKTNIATGFSVP